MRNAVMFRNQHTDKPVDQMVKIWKVIEVSVLLIGTLCFAVAIFLSYYYLTSTPNHPDPSASRVYRHEVHGQIAYLNAQEKNTLNTLFWIAGIGAVLGVCIEKYRPRA
jgi:hypothetical protein